MSQQHHQLVRDYFAAVNKAQPTDDLVTPDMTAWTTSSGLLDGAKYRAGVRGLQALFPEGLTYTIETLTAEDDRVAAEVQAHGVLLTGETYRNTYVFMIRIRDGRIAAVAEHFNPKPTAELIAPARAALAKAAG